jgi:hypothetical protein
MAASLPGRTGRGPKSSCSDRKQSHSMQAACSLSQGVLFVGRGTGQAHGLLGAQEWVRQSPRKHGKETWEAGAFWCQPSKDT